MTQVTATASKRSFIHYQCPKCGQYHLYEYIIKGKGQSSYHIFQSSNKQIGAQNKAGDIASSAVEKQDEKLYNSINITKSYEYVSQKIHCPGCKEKQPWSDVPKKWKEMKYIGLWYVILICLSVYALGMIAAFPYVSIAFGCMAAITALLPVFNIIRRKRATKRIASSSFVPPIYFNHTNIHMLKEMLQPSKPRQST